MSIENPFKKSESGSERPKLTPVSQLNAGDKVLANGNLDEIVSKRRDGTEYVLQLKSGEYIRVDDENEEIEVPNS